MSMHPSTLMQFYAGIDRRKIRYELLGEEYKRPNFHELIRNLIPAVTKRYQEVKHKLTIDTTSKKQATKKQRRTMNWAAVRAIIESPNTPENLKKAWEKRLDLHDQGLSDQEIKKRLKKNA